MSDTLPLEHDMKLHSGVTFQQSFRWKPDGVTGQDLTGWDGVARIGPHHGTPWLELTPGDGLTLGADGLISLTLTADETTPLDADLFYDLDLIDPDGGSLRFMRGWLYVVQDFTP